MHVIFCVYVSACVFVLVYVHVCMHVCVLCRCVYTCVWPYEHTCVCVVNNYTNVYVGMLSNRWCPSTYIKYMWT